MPQNTVPLTRHIVEGIEEGQAGDREPPLAPFAAPLTCCAICCASSPQTGIVAPIPLSRKCVSAGIIAQSGHYEDWLSGLIIPWSCVRITPGLVEFGGSEGWLLREELPIGGATPPLR